MTSRIVVALSLSLALLGGAPSWAEEAGETAKLPFQAPGVLLSFEGGNAAGNLASVLDLLQKNGVPVPTRPHVFDGKETVCSLLMGEKLPPPCGSLVPVIQALNPKTNFNKLRPGETLNLPDLAISSYTASGQFAPYDAKLDSRGKDIKKNWSHLNPNVEPRPDGSRSVTYQAYQVYVPATDDEGARKLADELAALSSRNVLVDPLLAQPRPARVFSTHAPPTADLMSQACQNGTLAPISYSDYVKGDADAIESVKKSLPQARVTVPVWLIDEPLVPSPNLYPAFGPTPGPPGWTWTCKWTAFSTSLHHANHMAGIIASQSEKFGFVGLAPNVTIKQARWLEPGPDGTLSKVAARDISLALQIVANENGGGVPLRVYLMASQYDDASTVDLANPDQRFTMHRLTKTIFDNHPLLIAAAGQAEEGQVGIDLTTKTPISPMNLGDLDNVVIVTACAVCERATAKLMPEAYFSSGEHKLVHVAAPGGKPIGGWVSSDAIGAADGTSQAAAYAAGVAASMISNYPTVYTQARVVKQRLQVTSWPLPIGAGVSQDAGKLAAGVVDPVLALLDPGKTWYKSGGWHSGPVRGLSLDTIPFTDGNQYTKWIAPNTLLRLMKAEGGRLSVYTNRYLIGDGVVGEVGRMDGVVAPTTAALVMCDGSRINLNDLDDFIPAIQGISDGSCK